MATIGRKAAVADLQFVRLSGSLAWWLWSKELRLLADDLP
jgi:NADH dehydrogenase FAD-containing subunit